MSVQKRLPNSLMFEDFSVNFARNHKTAEVARNKIAPKRMHGKGGIFLLPNDLKSTVSVDAAKSMSFFNFAWYKINQVRENNVFSSFKVNLGETLSSCPVAPRP